MSLSPGGNLDGGRVVYRNSGKGCLQGRGTRRTPVRNRLELVTGRVSVNRGTRGKDDGANAVCKCFSSMIGVARMQKKGAPRLPLCRQCLGVQPRYNWTSEEPHLRVLLTMSGQCRAVDSVACEPSGPFLGLVTSRWSCPALHYNPTRTNFFMTIVLGKGTGL